MKKYDLLIKRIILVISVITSALFIVAPMRIKAEDIEDGDTANINIECSVAQIAVTCGDHCTIDTGDSEEKTTENTYFVIDGGELTIATVLDEGYEIAKVEHPGDESITIDGATVRISGISGETNAKIIAKKSTRVVSKTDTGDKNHIILYSLLAVIAALSILLVAKQLKQTNKFKR